ncbi:unnamed protein product [Protopolystoma xenopodis]|uniref:Uncharacterized protein n=1 Tax=Protopolystoma xenopodis TaxID=117903 RepID=A0A448XCZ4_9PLAT|nr:unnamed protein product [Protopolystoma xenopodis]
MLQSLPDAPDSTFGLLAKAETPSIPFLTACPSKIYRRCFLSGHHGPSRTQFSACWLQADTKRRRGCSPFPRLISSPASGILFVEFDWRDKCQFITTRLLYAARPVHRWPARGNSFPATRQVIPCSCFEFLLEGITSLLDAVDQSGEADEVGWDIVKRRHSLATWQSEDARRSSSS